MADPLALVARELNQVSSVGEEHAAIQSALARISYGLSIAGYLSTWSSPTPQQATDTLLILQSALEGEARAASSSADDAPVDPASWARTRRDIERAYVEVSGVEGAAGVQTAIDPVAILADAIANAPRVFAEGLGGAVRTVGEIAGDAGGGFLGGLGVMGALVLALVAVIVLRTKGLV
jgi:hypothetical protein